VETELYQQKKKLNTPKNLAATHTQTATRKTMLSKTAAGSFKTDFRFGIDRKSAYLVALHYKKT
jgi:hypothetical protein